MAIVREMISLGSICLVLFSFSIGEQDINNNATVKKWVLYNKYTNEKHVIYDTLSNNLNNEFELIYAIENAIKANSKSCDTISLNKLVIVKKECIHISFYDDDYYISEYLILPKHNGLSQSSMGLKAYYLINYETIFHVDFFDYHIIYSLESIITDNQTIKLNEFHSFIEEIELKKPPPPLPDN